MIREAIIYDQRSIKETCICKNKPALTLLNSFNPALIRSVSNKLAPIRQNSSQLDQTRSNSS